MNELQIFKYEENEIRIVQRDGQPWWVLKDVCAVLGIGNTADTASRLDDDEKGIGTIDTLGGIQQVTVISEAGVYSAILLSRKPEAKAFKRWITHEVLPSIRKHGAYMTPETLHKMISSPDFGIRLLTALKDEQEKNQTLTIDNEQLRLKAAEDKPKVVFADAVSTSSTDILIGELAKILKGNGVEIGQNRLFEWMRENGYLIKRAGRDFNMPTQFSMERDLFKVKETAISHSDGHVSISFTTKVTGKGQAYFVNLFLTKSRDIERAA